MSSSPQVNGGHNSTSLRGDRLPSFKPTRDRRLGSEHGESSASGSRRSTDSHNTPEPYPDRVAAVGSAGMEGRAEETAHTTKRRSRPHSSGGFLLESIVHPPRISRTIQSAATSNPADPNGKRKSTDSDIIVPKRNSRRSRYENPSPITSSPLATEVRHEHDAATLARAGTFVPGTDIRYAHTSPNFNEPVVRTGPPKSAFETDPAQIVNMALSLSAARRRQALGTRTPSNDIGVRRAVSGALSARQVSRASYVNPYPSPRQQPSVNSSPRVQQNNSGTWEAASQPDHGLSGDKAVTGFEVEEDEVPFYISPPTAARVQKAKTYFELAYEHRRLLSHLPPVRRPGTQVSPLQAETKVYNPLQYVRNRKLRFAEKQPILAESQGWHNVEHVREWVDAVVEGHTATRHDPTECVRLPELKRDVVERDLEEVNESVYHHSPFTSTRKMSIEQPLKPRRPRSDWVTHPGDLIADAFWLEQGLNKTKIRDREGNPIYPPDTAFTFSGWRNITPQDVPAGLQDSTPEKTPEPEAERMSTRSATVPELPVFSSANANKKKTKRKGHRMEKIRNSISAAQERRGSPARRKKFLDIDDSTSGSDLSGNEPDDEANFRGRRLISRRRPNAEQKSASNPERSPEKDSDKTESREHKYGKNLMADSKTASVADSKLARFFTRESTKPGSLHKQSNSRSDSDRRDSDQLPRPRTSLGDEVRPRTSADYDTTAPSSPVVSSFPSIAINLSPPTSRSPSPSKKHSLPSILQPFRDRSHEKHRQGIETADFAEAESKPLVQQITGNADKTEESSNSASRGTSPMTRGISPGTKPKPIISLLDDDPLSIQEHRGSTISRVSTRSAMTESSSRIRGMFKGGRIAELVGNEVSRVGDFIWKRDVPAPYRARMGSGAASLESDDTSNSDGDTRVYEEVLKTPRPQQLRRTESTKSTPSPPSFSPSSPESGGSKQYHNPNLPSFTSPFQQDRDKQDEIKRASLGPDDGDRDHISRLAAQHRSVSRSSRLDRLAPPKLEISRSASSVPPIGRERRDSYGFGGALSRSQNASQIFNDSLKTNGTMVTGLTSLRASRSATNLEQLARYNSRDEPIDFKPTLDSLKRDIARATTLAYSQIIKARQIIHHAESMRTPIPQFLLDSMDPPTLAQHTQTPFQIARKDEHIFAAHNIITTLTTQSTTFRAAMDTFAASFLPTLHTQIQTLEDNVDGNLVPRVRKAVDDAGELSMKLTTTSTLAVKGINEALDSAFRRRRRGPFRWVRRLGYVLIEWWVVGLLWMIWLVVTSVRVLGHVIYAVLIVFGWLFWLV